MWVLLWHSLLMRTAWLTLDGCRGKQLELEEHTANISSPDGCPTLQLNLTQQLDMSEAPNSNIGEHDNAQSMLRGGKRFASLRSSQHPLLHMQTASQTSPNLRLIRASHSQIAHLCQVRT